LERKDIETSGTGIICFTDIGAIKEKQRHGSNRERGEEFGRRKENLASQQCVATTGEPTP